MAGADFFDITIHGLRRAWRAPEMLERPGGDRDDARPGLADDRQPQRAAAEPAVLSITQIHSGSAYNVIPGDANLCGTVRGFLRPGPRADPRTHRAISAGMAAAFDVEIVADVRDTFGVRSSPQRPAVLSACMASIHE